ncbi:MAG TPA: PQQ-binding-like beta-propeller repeat protein [Acidobacteriota bacterium]|nr:PQQ-binding-like beta-propeller repeat protein [Acidobacteriota bacterium]
MFSRSFILSALVLISISASGGDWPQFRGPDRNNISVETGLLRGWPAQGPKVLWKTPVCEGYAGAAIKDGRIYLNDYDDQKKEHLIRCISLADGKDIWRWSYPVEVRPNHGITRTVPAVGQKLVFSLDPKCRFHALDAKTGKLIWQKNLVQDYKTTIPGWYAGQNPLIDGDRVLLATGGDALVVAFDQETGKEVWRTPNAGKELMSHSSLMPATIGGVKQYLYLTMKNLYGIAASDGQVLWSAPFTARIVAVPSPISIGDGRIFITSGYEAGSAMYQVDKGASGFTARKLFSLTSTQFNSEAQTPILFQNHLFAVSSKTKGRFTCLDLDGKIVWQSPVVSGNAESSRTFGLGTFLLADGMFFILDGNTGMLRLVEGNIKEYKELASAQILNGEDVWGPMALSDGKLIIRDMSQMVCLQVGRSGGGKKQ